MQKLPPFGKTLYDRQLQGLRPTNDVYLFIGKHAWEKAKDFQVSRPTTMCLPPGDSALDYKWPIDGCDILIFDTSEVMEQELEDLAKFLFSFGANIIRYISSDNLLTVFKKDF